METKKRIDWLSEVLNLNEITYAKRVLTYQLGEEVVTKDMALYAILSELKSKYDVRDWDCINAEKFNNKVHLKMEDWEVNWYKPQNYLVFRNGKYSAVMDGDGLNFNEVSDESNETSVYKSDVELLLKLFRPELERVTNEFNNR